ncbi:MAG: hypothetical protein ABJA67_14225 [Chthonomonadales bacterium]
MSYKPYRWIFNGIMVTGTEPGIHSQRGSTYRGISHGAPWPIAMENVASCTTLIQEVSSRFVTGPIEGAAYPIATTTCLTDVREYLRQCETAGISVRILLVQTDRPAPDMRDEVGLNLAKAGTELGFDYAYSSGEYSALYSDVYPPISASLSTFGNRLNEIGLFISELDLNDYVHARNEFALELEKQRGLNIVNGVEEIAIETTGDFVRYRLWEILESALLC